MADHSIAVAKHNNTVHAANETRAVEVMSQAGKFLDSPQGYSLTANSIVIAALCASTLWILTADIIGVMIGISAGLVTMLGGTLYTAISRAKKAPRANHLTKKEIEEARWKSESRMTEMTKDDSTWVFNARGIRALMDDESAKDIADNLAIRLRDLHAAWKSALKENGRANPDKIIAEAHQATLALVGSAIASHMELVQAIKAGDEITAPDVARRFAETARAVAGIPSQPAALPPPSASAALQRLIGLAENALSVDPDLVDDAGARLDHLVRQHLPRLLETHAAAARAAGPVDLAAVDDELTKGVEQVRASVEEALARDARHRFDALRTEVAFLSARRGS